AKVIVAMPAAKFDLGAFEKFLTAIVTDERFDAEDLIPEIERQAGRLGVLDRYLVYPVAIALMRNRLMMLRDRFLPMEPLTWGPGRVDTFNSAKALFNFPFHRMPESEKIGVADFPSVWNQGPREGMQLHWDGNNCRVEERNKSAAFGTGTTPATIDLGEIDELERWLNTLKPPPWPRDRWPIDQAKAAQGKQLYDQYCSNCHGWSGTDFNSRCMNEQKRQNMIRQCEMQGQDVPYGACIGSVMPIGLIKTDVYRLWSYTYDLAANQGMLYANVLYNDGAPLPTSYAGGTSGGHTERFMHFRKTYGYANMPLDGIWLRGPYLHNGSVPTLRDLLEPMANRPTEFYRGYDVIDPVKVGFVSQKTRTTWLFRTRNDKNEIIPGNGNQGHEGPAYGTTLAPDQKDAIVEYLKTF
ncbi:MAG: di-heme-cytochrome C peroxidase, partial [Thermoanaerobaculia bacterium]